MTIEELRNTEDVNKLTQEIYEFYKESNEKNNYGITDEKLWTAALNQAFREKLIEMCKAGEVDPPENCKDCPLHKLVEYPEAASKFVTDKEYVICSMAPAYIAHQPNLKLVGRPSYCPMRETDEMYEAVQMLKIQMNESAEKYN